MAMTQAKTGRFKKNFDNIIFFYLIILEDGLIIFLTPGYLRGQRRTRQPLLACRA
jgi:uncharacterized protein with PQ loop repeat